MKFAAAFYYVPSLILAVTLPTLQSAAAQDASPKPPKPLFGGKTGTANPSPAQGKRLEASQEQMADAILGDMLNRIWSQSDEHFHQGEYFHAINLNRIVIQGDPHNMDAYSNNAWLLWSIGVDQSELAVEMNRAADDALKQGVDANQKTYYMYDEAGRHYFLLRKDPEKASAYFEKAVKFDCPWFTWNALAECYERSNLWDKAVTAWEKAAMYPDNRVARRRLRQAKDHIAQPNNSR